MALSFDEDKLRAAFKKHADDRGKADTLNLVEFGEMLVELTGKHDWSVKDDIQPMFNGVKGDDDEVTFDELWTGITGKPATSKQLDELFSQWDKDGSGALSKAELADALKSQANFSDEKVESVLESADTSDDGKISKEEFIKACTA